MEKMKTFGVRLLRLIVAMVPVVQLLLPFLFIHEPTQLLGERDVLDVAAHEVLQRLQRGLTFYSSHLAYPLAPVLVLLAMGIYTAANYSRTHPPRDKRGKLRRPPQPPRISLRQVLNDATDIVVRLDHPVWRVAYLAGAIAATVLPARIPVTVDQVRAITADPGPVLLAAGVPLLLTVILLWRIRAIMSHRMAWIDEMYAIARDCLDYKPLPERGTPTNRQRITATPHLAIEVRQWKNLTDGDSCFVWVPEKFSASDQKAWDEFGVNLDEKMPREEEWRIRTKGFKGRGAMVGPANYPRAILWDGEYDPDPLTFVLGADLETGADYRITFNDVSPHAAISGGTASGKTSGAEIIAAQTLVKPMPWDPTLFGQVHVIDPKGPLAQRWAGRPGVVVSNGQEDSAVEPYIYDPETGDVLCEKTGFMVMADHLQHIENEHKRRVAVLAQYSDAATWVDLPDEVKRDEKFFPIVVITDEFLDHTSSQRGKGDRIELENEAREFIVSMTDWQLRKARNVGIHILLIAQRANMKLIGDTMMTNMPVRMVTGQIDGAQINSMFAIPEKDVPRLPSTYRDPETAQTKTIPGRARILNALGQSIFKIQIMWFGKPRNSRTLNKWLPRGDRPPNGDFSLPTNTRARTAADFDADGNLISGPNDWDTDPDNPQTDSSPDTPTTGTQEAQESPATQPTETHEPAEPPAPPPHQQQDQEEAGRPASQETPNNPLDPADAPEEDRAAEPDAPEGSDAPSNIFPGAGGEETETCAACTAAYSWRCPQCNGQYCTDHGDRTRNPDPSSPQRFLCGSCAAQAPLAAVGLAPVLGDVLARAERHGLRVEHGILASSDGPYGELLVRAEDGKKIVEVHSREAPTGVPGDAGFVYRARSASGTVEGLTATLDRIDLAVQTYLRSREEATQASGQGSH